MNVEKVPSYVKLRHITSNFVSEEVWQYLWTERGEEVWQYLWTEQEMRL